jgi:alkanesulfonate monooxygenase SsuD/methylene tetrahydromethanopterin reductase-like flavin-dependent oxidoreductase (luciferase family)
MVALNVIAVETDQEAQRLATTLQQQFLHLMRGNEVPLQPPVDDIRDLATSYEIESLQNSLGSSIVGSPETVKEKLQKFIDESEADEIMAIAQVFDHQARLRSYEILADITKRKS